MKTDQNLEVIGLIDKLFFLNDKILDSINNENIKKAYLEIENRDRLINIIQKIQQDEKRPPETKSKLGEISTKIKILMEEDLLIIEKLNQLKKATQLEMGKTYENRSKIEGYNLRKVRWY